VKFLIYLRLDLSKNLSFLLFLRSYVFEPKILYISRVESKEYIHFSEILVIFYLYARYINEKPMYTIYVSIRGQVNTKK
jgi:hypothetical protein